MVQSKLSVAEVTPIPTPFFNDIRSANVLELQAVVAMSKAQ
ncbi:hypothetical protein [Cohnella mopanensis]|nr:hypothetical protein [Cohnella mopanensis]